MRLSPRLTPLAIVSASVLTLTGCVHPTRTPETEKVVACGAFRPITFSRLHDTEETIRQVREHNAAYLALCGKGAEP